MYSFGEWYSCHTRECYLVLIKVVFGHVAAYTHFFQEIHEANSGAKGSESRRDASRSQEKGRNNGGVSVEPTARLYVQGPQVSLFDAASSWKRPSVSDQESSFCRGPDSGFADTRFSSQTNLSTGSGPLDPSVSSDLESPQPSFVPSRIGASAAPSVLSDFISLSNSAPGIPSIENSQATSGHVDAAVALMNSIQTDRVPCPRMCGATFGPGGAGLAIFRNGRVRKAWQWWESSNPSRLATVPGSIGEPAPSTLFRSGTSAAPLDNGRSESIELSTQTTDFPRSLKDLSELTTAARAAQWGEQRDSEVSSAADHAASDDFFEEDSLGSDDDPDLLDDDEKTPNDMYRQYFGSSRLAFVIPSENGERPSQQDGEAVERPEDDVPPSDLLAPNVSIWCKYDRLSLNGQSVMLAKAWRLWDTSLPNNNEETSDESKPLSDNDKFPVQQKQQNSPDGVRSPSPLPPKPEPASLLANLFIPPKEAVLANTRGGPPRTIVPSTRSQFPPFPSSEESVLQHKKQSESPPGLYVLPRAPATVNQNSDLTLIKEICLYNARAGRKIGEKAKSEVWELLAKLVDMNIKQNVTSFNGWSGLNSTSIGVSVVESLLRYYESLGDVQMLASIVCVLRGRRNPRDENTQPRLIPDDPVHNSQTNNYIRKYSDLLFAWGLLNIRVEVRKHIVTQRPESVDQQQTWLVGQPPEPENDGKTIGLAFTCARCGTPTEPGRNGCRSCQDYVFRCVICDHAVRGLFTVCKSCGHGGHMNHLQEWFRNTDVCPSGCGCRCKLQQQEQPAFSNQLQTARSGSSTALELL